MCMAVHFNSNLNFKTKENISFCLIILKQNIVPRSEGWERGGTEAYWGRQQNYTLGLHVTST